MKSTTKEFIDIPNGRYKGRWSGTKVVVDLPSGLNTEISVNDVVLGLSVPCQVIVSDNQAIVETICN